MSSPKVAYPDIIIPRLILVPRPGQYVACDEAVAGYRDDLRDLARSCLGLADFLAGRTEDRLAADLRSIGTSLDAVRAGLGEVVDLVSQLQAEADRHSIDRLTDENEELEQDVSRLEERNDELERDNDRLRRALRRVVKS